MKTFLMTLFTLLIASIASGKHWEGDRAELNPAPHSPTTSDCIQIYSEGFICDGQFVSTSTSHEDQSSACRQQSEVGLPCNDNSLADVNAGKVMNLARADDDENCTRLYQYGYICDNEFVTRSTDDNKGRAIELVLGSDRYETEKTMASLANMPRCSLVYSFGQYCNDHPYYGLTMKGCENLLNPGRLVDFCLDYSQ